MGGLGGNTPSQIMLRYICHALRVNRVHPHHSVFPAPLMHCKARPHTPAHNACSFLRQWHTLSCTCTATYSSWAPGQRACRWPSLWQKRALPPPCWTRTPPPRWSSPRPTAARSRSPTPAWPPCSAWVRGRPGRQRDGAHPRRPCARRPGGRTQRHAIAGGARRWRCARAIDATGLHRAQPRPAPHGLWRGRQHAGRAHRAGCASAPGGHPAHARRSRLHRRCRPGQASQRLCAPLVVAADSRFSAARRQLGIGAQMTDFGRTVIVCRMRHTEPHADTAHECFGYERTLAVLPPAGRRCGPPAVLGRGHGAGRRRRTPDGAGARRIHGRGAGAVPAPAGRHGADRAAPRLPAGRRVRTALHRPAAALLGDAAVGMHPVTAHGYNLGLAGWSG